MDKETEKKFVIISRTILNVCMELQKLSLLLLPKEDREAIMKNIKEKFEKIKE